MTATAIEFILKENGLQLVSFAETIDGFDVQAIRRSTGGQRRILLTKGEVKMVEDPMSRGEPPFRIRLREHSRRPLPQGRRIRRR